mgnify:FL=1
MLPKIKPNRSQKSTRPILKESKVKRDAPSGHLPKDSIKTGTYFDEALLLSNI